MFISFKTRVVCVCGITGLETDVCAPPVATHTQEPD